jgi:hypothetical protein
LKRKIFFALPIHYKTQVGFSGRVAIGLDVAMKNACFMPKGDFESGILKSKQPPLPRDFLSNRSYFTAKILCSTNFSS